MVFLFVFYVKNEEKMINYAKGSISSSVGSPLGKGISAFFCVCDCVVSSVSVTFSRCLLRSELLIVLLAMLVTLRAGSGSLSEMYLKFSVFSVVCSLVLERGLRVFKKRANFPIFLELFPKNFFVLVCEKTIIK